MNPPHEVMVEQIHRQDARGYWVEIYVERLHYIDLGPFATSGERQRAQDDLNEMMRARGAKPVSPMMQ